MEGLERTSATKSSLILGGHAGAGDTDRRRCSASSGSPGRSESRCSSPPSAWSWWCSAAAASHGPRLRHRRDAAARRRLHLGGVYAAAAALDAADGAAATSPRGRCTPARPGWCSSRIPALRHIDWHRVTRRRVGRTAVLGAAVARCGVRALEPRRRHARRGAHRGVQHDRAAGGDGDRDGRIARTAGSDSHRGRRADPQRRAADRARPRRRRDRTWTWSHASRQTSTHSARG